MKVALGLLFSIFSVVANAQAPASQNAGRPDFSATLDLNSTQFSNANRASNAADEIDERQTTTALNLLGAIDASFLQFQLDYQARKTNYSEDTQEGESEFLGRSQLTFGNVQDPFQLAASHSINQLQRDPLTADLEQNREERAISSLSFVTQTKPQAVNQFFIEGELSDIQFEESFLNESNEYNFTLGYNRSVSQASTLTVAINYESIDFRYLDEADYDNTALSVGFSTRLRRLNYAVNVGFFQSENDNAEDETGFVGSIELGFGDALNSVDVLFNQELTNTSGGNGNDDFFARDTTIDGFLEQQDQLQRRSLSAIWRYQLLCRSCDMRFSLGIEEDRYFNFAELDTRENFVDLLFSYRLSKNRSLSVQVKQLSYELTSGQDDQNFDDQSFQLAYNIKNLVRNLNLQFFASQQERDFNAQDGFSNDAYGLRLSYQLY